jgi:hypothetical protein
MKRIALPLACILPFALASCGNLAPGSATPAVSGPPIVSGSVAAAEIALTNAERLALHYTGLPRCGTAAATPLCSNPATVQQIKDYDNRAYAAVKAARANEALLGLALSAIDAFGSIIPK